MPKRNQATVFVADDHDLILASLKAILDSSPTLECVGMAMDGVTAVAQCRAKNPDLLILDLSLPGAPGLDVLGEIRQWCKSTKVLVLTGQSSAAMLRAALDMGAHGLATKLSSIKEIERGIYAVLQSGRWISETAKDLLGEAEAAPSLSPRETQILTLIVNGLSNRDIAERLSLSPKTVENHRTRTMGKLGVRSRAELLSYALQNDLIDPSNALSRGDLP